MSGWEPITGWLCDGLGDEPRLPARCVYCGTTDSEVWWVRYRFGEAQWYLRQDICDDCQRSRWAVRHWRRHRRAAARRADRRQA